MKKPIKGAVFSPKGPPRVRKTPSDPKSSWSHPRPGGWVAAMGSVSRVTDPRAAQHHLFRLKTHLFEGMGRHQGQTSASFAAGHNRPGACGTCVSGSEKGRATVRRVIGEGKRRPPSGSVLFIFWPGKTRFFGCAELCTGVLSALCPFRSHSSSTTTGAACLTLVLPARCEIQWAPPVAPGSSPTRSLARPRKLTHLRGLPGAGLVW